MEAFLFSPRKFPIQTWLCNCQQYLCLFLIDFECSPNIHDQGKMLVLPNRLLYWVLSTSDHHFVSFQPIWCHTYTDKNDGVRTGTPNWQPFPNRASIGFSQTAFLNSPAKGWPYRFRSRGTTGSSILDHDFGHLCFGRRIRISGRSDFGIFIIFHFDLDISGYCVCCLSCASW